MKTSRHLFLISAQPLSVLMLCLTLLGSCRPEEKSVRLTLETERLEVPAEGGHFSVAYRTDPDGRTIRITAAAERAWIGEIRTEQPGCISFDVTPNPDAEVRTNRIEIASASLSRPAVLTVVQSAAAEVADLEIRIGEITESGIRYSVTPKDPQMTYIIRHDTKKNLADYPDDESLARSDREFFEGEALWFGQTLEQYLNDVLMRGTYEGNIAMLKPDTDYEVYAYGLTAAGERTTKIYRTAFRTGTPEMIEMDFSIDLVVDGPSVRTRVQPSRADQGYYYGFIPKQAFEESGMDYSAYLQDRLDVEISFGVINGMSVEEMLAQLLHTGDRDETVTLKASSPYIFCVAAVNASGFVCSVPVTRNFETEAVRPSDNEIAISIREVSVDFVSYEITTTNDDPYVFFIQPAAELAGMSDEEIIRSVLENPDLEMADFTLYGNAAEKYPYLTKDTEYLAYAFGYLAGSATTGLQKASFRTLTPGDPKDLTFTFSIDEIGLRGGTVTVQGTPVTAGYYWDVRPAGMTPEEFLRETDEMIEAYIEMGYVTDRAAFFASSIFRGTSTYTFTNAWMAGYEYRALAVGIEEETGSYATAVSTGEVFRTEDPVISEATVTLEADRYFDGDELMDVYPDYDVPGRAVIPVKAIPSEDADHYYYHLFQGDLTDETLYPNELIVLNLIQGGISEPFAVVSCDFGATVTLLGIARDKDGNFGKAFRKKMTVTKDGVSDVSEFPAAGSTAVRKAAPLR